jgi:hypothetical protein
VFKYLIIDTGIGNIYSNQENTFKPKKTIKIALDGFLYIFKTLVYANKSKINEGYKPKAIFKTIAITATA